MSREGFVTYTDAINKIIQEEADKHPNNLKEGFRVAAERIKSEEGEMNITPEKISTRYYTNYNDRKASKKRSTNNNSSKISEKKSSKVVSKSSRGTTTSSSGVDLKLQLVRDLTKEFDNEQKLVLIKDLYSEI
jgi:hypothetical protein